MFFRDAFVRYCDCFVTLCHQVILPQMEAAQRALEAQGWLCDLHFTNGEPASRRHPIRIEPEVTLTFRLPGADTIRSCVRFKGNSVRQGVEVAVGRVGETTTLQYLSTAEVTPAVVEAHIEQAVATFRSTPHSPPVRPARARAVAQRNRG